MSSGHLAEQRHATHDAPNEIGQGIGRRSHDRRGSRVTEVALDTDVLAEGRATADAHREMVTTSAFSAATALLSSTRNIASSRAVSIAAAVSAMKVRVWSVTKRMRASRARVSGCAAND